MPRNNQLTWEQAFKLRDVLSQERAYLNEAMLRLEQAAVYLSAKVGFHCTAKNVESVARQGGLSWRRARRPPREKPGKKVAMEARFELLHQIRLALVSLLAELRCPVPPALLVPFSAGGQTYALPTMNTQPAPPVGAHP